MYNLACEWGKDGIRINGVSPWYTRTPLADQVLKSPEFHKEVHFVGPARGRATCAALPFADNPFPAARCSRQVCDRTPLRRVATADEVSSVVAFLCMPAASYVTGQVLAVDGGFLRSAFFEP